MKRLSNSDKLFLIIDYTVLILLLLIVAYPLLYIIMSSVSLGPQNMTLYLIPKKVSIAGYIAMFNYNELWTGYANSIINVVLGTTISLTVTMLCAYPLSRPEFRFRKIMMTLCMITMYFSGGLIPTYLVVRNVGLLNTRWSLIIPGCMSVYNMIVTRTYIQSSIPGDIRESAQIDGCSNLRYLISMVLPLSKPVIAVIGLFYAVGIWNAYFSAMIYVPMRRNLFPLALVLREILILNKDTGMELATDASALALEEQKELMKYSVIIISSLPVMVLYPFVQKFFVKGVMIGAVKG